MKTKKQNFPHDDPIHMKAEKLTKSLLSSCQADGNLVKVMSQQMFLAERELQMTRAHLLDTIGKLNERDLEIIRLQGEVNKFLS